ncbi:MAG: hypothetical protein CMC15_18755 [Flavobacteriaceae bacterium]|nr:hypothetical protein [Flavobacteriaceae bacterium]
MNERYVLEALQKGVTQAVQNSDYDTTPVKYLGRVFTPPDQGHWLELIYIPNNPTNEFWDTSKTYRGVLRLLFFEIANNEGSYGLLEKAENISNYFTKGVKLSDESENVIVNITENANVMNVLEEDSKLLVPVSIRYSFFGA